jgi:hypothetical protein
MSGVNMPKWFAVPLIVGGFIWKRVTNILFWIVVVLGLIILRQYNIL